MLINYQNGKPIIQGKLPITPEMRQSIQKADEEKLITNVQSNLLLVSQFGNDEAVTTYLKTALETDLKGVQAPEIKSLWLVLKANKKHRRDIVKAAFVEHL